MLPKRTEDVAELMSTAPMIDQEDHPLRELLQQQQQPPPSQPHVQIDHCGNSSPGDALIHDGDKDADDTNRQDSDSGRCTPQEIEIFRDGSPTVRFEEILIDVINTSTIHVDWCPVTNNPDVIGYKIRYAIKDNPSYSEVFVTSGISSYTISGLKPNTEYIVSICAIDEKENVIQQCGWASQRTDETGDRRRPQSSPYIALVIAAVLLTTAFVVPLTILIVHNYDTGKHFDAPTLTAVAAILLLLVAIVVPVTLLFVRTCGQCDPPTSDRGKVTNTMVQNKDTLPATDSTQTNEDMEEETLPQQRFQFRNRSSYKAHRGKGRSLH